MFGPHATGAERFLTVSSGTPFAQVAKAILGKQAQVQNPDKDEPRCCRRSARPAGGGAPPPPSSAGRRRTPWHTSPLARYRGHCIERSGSTRRQSAPQERMGSPWSVRRLVIRDIRS
jgi:hypothetical protein